MKNVLSKRDLNYLASINAAGSESVESFIAKLESGIRKIFPKSFIKIEKPVFGGEALLFEFAGSNGKWEHNFIANDPLYHIMGIHGANPIHNIEDNPNPNMGDKIETELMIGGSIKLSGTLEDNLYENKSIKTGFRDVKGSPDKVISYLIRYFQKLKKIAFENKSEIKNWDSIKGNF